MPSSKFTPRRILTSIFLVTLGAACALSSLGSWGARADTIAYYRFETGPAGAVATSIVDSSGHNLNGAILSGAPTYNSAIPVSQIPLTGQTDTLSMHFGVGDAANFSFPFPFQTLTDATFEVWVNPTMNSTAYDQDFIWGAMPGANNGFQMYVTQTTHQACLNYLKPGGALHQLGCSAAGTVPLNQWSHIAYVKQGSVYSIYVTGPGTDYVTTLSSKVIDSSPNLPNGAGWSINGRAIYESSCCQYSGMLDEIRLSDQALTPSQFLVSPPFGPTWQARSAPVGGLTNPLLLTDGTVILHSNLSTVWYKLSPDLSGNYATGTWSQIASLPSGYGPHGFASAVLPDGRVLVEGGEQNLVGSPSVWTSLGAIYDPIADVWTPVAPPSGPGWINTAGTGCNGGIGDAASIVLPNGTFLLSAACANPAVDALFNATDLSWTATGAPSVHQDEAGYTMMQNGQVLMIDIGDPPNARTYDPATGLWSLIAQTPVTLPDTCGTYEIGPAVTRPDGSVVAFGGNTCATNPTAIYVPSSNSWIPGPNVPATCGTNGATSCTLADAPAALLPNGNVLFAASAGYDLAPSHWFEFTTTNVINQVSDAAFSTSLRSGAFNLLVLPNGQILASRYGNIVEFYTPSGGPNPAWAPTITSAASCVAPGSSYVLRGIQLNGLSQGAAFGDDVQAATNYPLIQIVNNATGHVFYARTSGFSTMSIAPHQVGTTNFKVASATEPGGSMLYVVTNGIPSVGRFVTVDSSCAANARTHDFNGNGTSDIIWRDGNGNVAFWLMSAAAVSSSGGYGGVPSTWSIVGQRDFNGDGTADLLWRDNLGNTAMWFMNGAQIASSSSVANIPASWTVAAVADFNGDGIGDILWRDGSGNLAVWLMNGAAVISSAGLGNLPLTWNVVGTGDFNGDGKADVLWRDNLGNTSIWFFNGTQVFASYGVGNIPISWSVAGTGDFNVDGMSDIVWRDNLGNTSVWLMNGANVSAAGGLGTIPTTWSIVQIGDYNGDGISDLLWRDGSGNTSVWFMNGTAVASTGSVGNIPTSWSVQSVNAE